MTMFQYYCEASIIHIIKVIWWSIILYIKMIGQNFLGEEQDIIRFEEKKSNKKRGG